jgi:uncharacterized protein (DUF427 family)
MKAVWNGTVIAESQDTVIVEGNHYFPLASVNAALLEPSTHTTVCSWKGTANYYSLKVGMNATRMPFGTTPSPRKRHAKSLVAWHSGKV